MILNFICKKNAKEPKALSKRKYQDT
jgi:hypothetical protein